VFVYANLLGEWTELTEDDKINGSSPQIFIEQILLNPKLQNNTDFVKLIKENNTFYLHKSCIQCTLSK